ncbi:uncharacterized protein LOC127760091 [Oryza glaberrima]|uniref:Uncharacterized protein n=1 Tax=Oryza glaberrima TaxID=4538 RepID=I1NQM0_ORYGL|nr:uncharacterized protein LOC127760091 [Oryza glaberrima]
MESAVQLPQYIFFDLSGSHLRCFCPPAPVMEHTGVPYDSQVVGLQALHRTRLSRAGGSSTIVSARPANQVDKAMGLCDRAAQIGDDDDDPDTVSDAGTSGVGVVDEEETAGDDEEDEVASLDELFCDERFVRKIDALAQLVGMDGAACQPAAVLGEVVRLIQETERKNGRCVCASGAVRS